jgi:tetratricopeptide (TPR) repeat protein
MNLTDERIFRGEDLNLSRDERAQRRCADAKKLQDVGDHEGARRAMGDLWQHVGERPNLEGLGDGARAEVLLRAGALSGFIGSSGQIAGAQEFAKNLIGESAEFFRAAGEIEREAESLSELGYCYWREGAHDEARIMLHESLARLAPESNEERAQTLLRLAIVESSATRYNDALRVLTQAAPLFDQSANDAKRGTFHMELAVALDALALAERREDYTDRALVEYAAASYHFERAGHARYRAAAENNYAYLLLKRGDYTGAHEHLDTARRIFVNLKDRTHAAQVDETRARVLVAEGRLGEAEAAARSAVRALGAGGEQALLAEALTAHGEALARLGRKDEARAVLRRAAETAERAGNLEGAGLAALTTLERLGDRLTPEEMSEIYLAADRLLERTQHPEILSRLRESARRVAATGRVETTVVAVAGVVENLIGEACARMGKQVRFEPAALASMLRLTLGADADVLRALVERTVERAEDGATITADAVETVMLRQQIGGADFADPWANFSFRGEVKQFEARLIEQALKDARGSVSRAARLLGFKHHESLNWRLKNRNKDLLQSRTPARKRRRSIIRKSA